MPFEYLALVSRLVITSFSSVRMETRFSDDKAALSARKTKHVGDFKDTMCALAHSFVIRLSPSIACTLQVVKE